MHNIKAIAKPIAEILQISYIGTLCVCLGMPRHAYQKYSDYFGALLKLNLYAKNQNNSLSHY